MKKHPNRWPTFQAYLDAHPRGVSQEEIARRLNLSSSAVSRLKHGWIPSKGAVLEKLRAAGINLAA